MPYLSTYEQLERRRERRAHRLRIVRDLIVATLVLGGLYYLFTLILTWGV